MKYGILIFIKVYIITPYLGQVQPFVLPLFVIRFPVMYVNTNFYLAIKYISAFK
ncbi:hypothetical protein DFO73_11524 [Cytobacillus oceanisediminis]|uniref:Uncharacterized protein n=1 Tax=Cytobacillus oceanisediminis TaxID=665099 RepID=A0A2V2ZQM7_9BACI|nr:hypothetical protein DFO73_11524 [Cytobacillus oceanisediminis]